MVGCSWFCELSVMDAQPAKIAIVEKRFLGERVVEEHVGKKRRKEVRQAITMKQELTSSLLVIAGVLVLGVALTATMTYMTITGVVPSNDLMTQVIPFAIVIVLLIFMAPRANKWWELRDEYKAHLERYNISKEDMAALKRGDL